MTTNSLAFRLFATAVAWTLLALPIAGAIIYSLYRAGGRRPASTAASPSCSPSCCPTPSTTATRSPATPRTWASRCSRSRIRAGTGRSSRSTAGRAARSSRARLPTCRYRCRASTTSSPTSARCAWPTSTARWSRRCASPRPSTCSARARWRSATRWPSPARWARSRRACATSARGSRWPCRWPASACSPSRCSRSASACFRSPRWRRVSTAIRSGEATRLDVGLPQEIEPLQQELNALLKSNQDIVERARTHVGNLAHALKTPLAVISNEARDDRARSRARSPSRPRS